MLPGLLIFACASVWAGNYSANGVATRAETMEAFTAVADDPSAVFYNPAGLTQIHHTEIDSGVAFLMPNIKYTNSMDGNSSHNSSKAVAPNLFASTNKWHPVYFGLGLYGPYGRVSNYDANVAVYNMMHFSKLVRVDFAPTVAVALGKYISVGAGLVGSRINASVNVLGLDESGGGYGVTGQGGVLIRLPERIKLGFVYHGHETAHLAGSGQIPGIQDNFLLRLNFPTTMSAGIAWQALNTLLLSATYDYEMWRTLKDINVRYNDPILNQIATITVNARNSDNIRFGLMYRPEHNDEFRLGYTYISAAIPQQYVIPAEPDYNGNLYAIGYSRYFTNIRLDAGYEYGAINDLVSTNTFFPGKHRGHLNTVMVGIAYSI